MEDAAWYGATHADERIALLAATYADARDTVVEGESGLLKSLPLAFVENWNRSLGELVLINGTRYKLFSTTGGSRTAPKGVRPGSTSGASGGHSSAGGCRHPGSRAR